MRPRPIPASSVSITDSGLTRFGIMAGRLSRRRGWVFLLSFTDDGVITTSPTDVSSYPLRLSLTISRVSCRSSLGIPAMRLFRTS